MLGNSKVALAYNSWPVTLAASLDAARSGGVRWSMAPELAQSGQNLDWVLPQLPGVLSAWTRPDPTHVLANFFPTPDATFEADLANFVDQVHTRFPYALVYTTIPWQRGGDAAADLMATHISNVCATRAAYCLTGDDERVWLKGADNGATNTSDGTHYSVAGQAAAVVAKEAVVTP
jgi:hypothetical protein